VNEPCRVCGEPTSEHCHAICYACGASFHLALRQDIPGKDCGEVWIDENHLALEFACNPCLTELRGVTVGATAGPQPGDARPRRRYVRRTGTRAGDVVRARRRRG